MKDLKDNRIIYIAGYGRSGSTLLAMLLNMVPGVYNLGELDNLYRADINHLPEYWKKIRMSLTEKNGVEKSKIKFSSLKWFFKRKKGNSLFKKFWLPVLNDLKKVHGARVLVDASKSTYLSFSRPFYYKKNGAQVKVIHIVRDLNGVVASFTKGRNSSHSKTLEKPKIGGAYRVIFNWLVVSVLTTILYRREFKEGSYYYLSYDKLMTDYQNELQTLFDFLELDLAPALFDDEIALEKDHSFSGNRLRLQSTLKINPYPHVKIGGIKGVLISLSSRIHSFIANRYA